MSKNSSLEETKNEVNNIKNVINTSKAIAKGSKVGGLYGAVIAGTWENRSALLKIIILLIFILLLPVLFIVLLPSLIFSGSDKTIMNNDLAILENINNVQIVINKVVDDSYNDIYREIENKINLLPLDAEGNIIENRNFYLDSYSIISKYSAYKHDYNELDIKDLEKMLENHSREIFYYNIHTSEKTIYDELDDGEVIEKKITVHNYVIQSTEVDIFLEKVFGFDEEKEKNYINYLDNLKIYLYGTYSLNNDLISSEVYKYSELVMYYAKLHDVEQFIEVIYAIMMTESGGRVVDVMQSSECEFNTLYPRQPNGITDTEYSIDVGIKYFAKALNMANCNSPVDKNKLSLALQGYNYGTGYITWASSNYGGYSINNAKEFSQIQKNKLGVSVYGNPNYVSKVFSYYGNFSGGVFGSPFLGIDWRAYITSEFGYRSDPFTGETKYHNGLDIGLPLGTPINSVEGGEILSIQKSNSGYGNTITIKHDNGIESFYAHLDKILVNEGQEIIKGEVIGLVGSTGRSTGPHLHLEIRLNGTRLNPRDYIG